MTVTLSVRLPHCDYPTISDYPTVSDFYLSKRLIDSGS